MLLVFAGIGQEGRGEYRRKEDRGKWYDGEEGKSEGREKGNYVRR